MLDLCQQINERLNDLNAQLKKMTQEDEKEKEDVRTEIYTTPSLIKRPRGRPPKENVESTFKCDECNKEYKVSYKEKHYQSKRHLAQQK